MGQRDALIKEAIKLQPAVDRLQQIDSEIEEIEGVLSALGRTAQLFDARFDPKKVKPIRPTKRTHGNSTYIRAALTVLREGNRAMTAHEITRGVFDLLSLTDHTAWSGVRSSIQGSLRKQAEKGIVIIYQTSPLNYAIADLVG